MIENFNILIYTLEKNSLIATASIKINNQENLSFVNFKHDVECDSLIESTENWIEDILTPLIDKMSLFNYIYPSKTIIGNICICAVTSDYVPIKIDIRAICIKQRIVGGYDIILDDNNLLPNTFNDVSEILS